MIDLTEEQIKRYSRHILLQDVGLEGQEKLLNAKVERAEGPKAPSPGQRPGYISSQQGAL